jgi:hypothetical protein
VWPRPDALRAALLTVFVAACGGDPAGPDPGPNLNCGLVQPTSLTPGQFSITDPTAQGACVIVPSVPTAGASGAEHLYLVVSTAGQEVDGGVTAPYSIAASSATATASETELPSPLVSAFRPQPTAPRFHRMLRDRERLLSTDPARMFDARETRAPAPSLAAAPALNDPEDFFVCADVFCRTFKVVNSRVRAVGNEVVIYVDDTVYTDPKYGALDGSGRYSDAELRDFARVFDNYLYPIDTLNFGRESDIDGNGIVQVLLTPSINALSGNCNDTGSVILGYFFANDLLSQPNSNNGEVFYSLVPDPLNSQCTINKDSFAKPNLAPTFVHEFQHMISFNEHFRERNGSSEDTWLNEGLSHYAEELAGRIVPDTTPQLAGRTYSDYSLSNFLNAYGYLSNPDTVFLITPADDPGSLNQRGADWLFVLWATEQFGSGTENLSEFRVRGTAFTRSLVQTNLTGAANVTAVSGEPFSQLVTQWQMANYLESLPGFNPSSPLIQYGNFPLRERFNAFHNAAASSFARPYPLAPDSTRTGVYSGSGTLRQGSGRHVRIIQSAGAPSVQLLLTNGRGGGVSATAVPRVGLVRVR